MAKLVEFKKLLNKFKPKYTAIIFFKFSTFLLKLVATEKEYIPLKQTNIFLISNSKICTRYMESQTATR